jgi:hypothetical protein
MIARLTVSAELSTSTLEWRRDPAEVGNLVVTVGNSRVRACRGVRSAPLEDWVSAAIEQQPDDLDVSCRSGILYRCAAAQIVRAIVCYAVGQ